MSHHEEQRLVALLQGSVESDDSSESSGDEARGARSGGQLFQSPLDLKLEGVGLEDLQPDMSFGNLVIKSGKANGGLDTEKLLSCRTCGLRHFIFLLYVKQVACYW